MTRAGLGGGWGFDEMEVRGWSFDETDGVEACRADTGWSFEEIDDGVFTRPTRVEF